MVDGLREHKKRATRQRISDIATAMFLARGFETVTIAEIAAAAEVSEKTVYNYFPAKESLVFDQMDEHIEKVVAAVRDRARGATPTSALLRAMQLDDEDFGEMIGERGLEPLKELNAMISNTPALQAAWGEYRHRLVTELTGVLATELTIDPADPEPLTAARALASLVELQYDSRLRHADSDIGVQEYQDRVAADLMRGARLLDTGMWSLHVMVEGRRTKDQIRDAANLTEHARQQVLTALRRAKREWISGHGKVAAHEAREAARRPHT